VVPRHDDKFVPFLQPMLGEIGHGNQRQPPTVGHRGIDRPHLVLIRRLELGRAYGTDHVACRCEHRRDGHLPSATKRGEPGPPLRPGERRPVRGDGLGGLWLPGE
jgi:hypothetical protein